MDRDEARWIVDTIAQLRVENERLQEAKRRALAVADERSKENCALRAALTALESDAGMRAFSASEAACYLWPEDTDGHKALRAAYIKGATSTALQSDSRPLVEFARWVIQSHCREGYDLGGDDVQEKAEKLGLIIATTYDPEKHGTTDLCEPGDPWFELAPLIADQGEDPGHVKPNKTERFKLTPLPSQQRDEK